MAEYPIVRVRADIEPNELEDVRLHGRYRQFDVRMRKTDEPLFTGHAVVELQDGARVLLEPIWDALARRPPQEIARFDGKLVAVVGLLFPVAPSSHDDPGTANLSMPCVSDIQSIEELPE